MKAIYYYAAPFEIVSAVKEEGEKAYSMKVKCIGAVETAFRPYGSGPDIDSERIVWGSYSYPLDLLERITVRIREDWGERCQYTYQVENQYVISLMADEPSKKLLQFWNNCD